MIEILKYLRTVTMNGKLPPIATHLLRRLHQNSV